MKTIQMYWQRRRIKKIVTNVFERIRADCYYRKNRDGSEAGMRTNPVAIAASLVRLIYLSIVTFSKIVSQIVFDVFRKLILEFWIQLEHFHESGNIDAFEITVGEGFDITA